MFDWISNGFDRIVQSVVWQSLISRFQWLDWLVIVFLAVGFIYGVRKGTKGVFSDILRLVIVVTLTFEMDDKVLYFLRPYIRFFPAHTHVLVSFIITAFVFWLIIYFFAVQLRKSKSKSSTTSQMLGGAVLGMIYLFLNLSFLSQVFILGPWESVKKTYEPKESYTGYMLSRATPKIHEFITLPIRYLAQRL